MTWDGRAAGEQDPWWDPEATELLPHIAPGPAEAEPWRADGDVADTRPLARIDAAPGTPLPPAPASRRAPRGRPRRGTWVVAALAASAVGGLAVGAVLTAATGRSAATPPPGPTSPDQAVPQPTRTGPAAYEVTVATANAAGAGTDSDVQARLTDESGRTSPWTALDTPDHNDFEAGSRDTYVVGVPAGFGRPASLQLWKDGTDAWAVEADVRVTGPDGYAALWHPAESASRLWITGSDPVPEDAAPRFTQYSPNGTLAPAGQ
ncbi:PLAT/LH2 domain-containing protein [Streptomyces sp. R44]|uniref:PLAT/LH2 domain-containing protein n=1 Tax=Streptomyces sp. R44 TaxID=3238633 RepID=A0AB39T0X6_9ACTN